MRNLNLYAYAGGGQIALSARDVFRLYLNPMYNVWATASKTELGVPEKSHQPQHCPGGWASGVTSLLQTPHSPLSFLFGFALSVQRSVAQPGPHQGRTDSVLLQSAWRPKRSWSSALNPPDPGNWEGSLWTLFSGPWSLSHLCISVGLTRKQ